MLATHSNAKRFLFHDPELLPELWPSMFDANYWRAQDAILGRSQGRGVTWFVQSERLPLVLRHYYRGGLIGKLLRDQFPFIGYRRSRSWREFQLLATLSEMGLPVPRPVAGQVERSGLIGRCDLLIERLPTRGDLVQILCKQALEQGMWQQIGAMLAKFHRHQVYHADLNAHNILLGEEKKMWLIDFDKGAMRSGERWKQATLQRLLRSFHKECTKNAVFHWQPSDWDALMAGYQQAAAQ